MFVLVSLLMFLPACSFFKPNIKEISSIQKIKKELDRADHDTLVIFDVDDTLTYNVNVPFQPWFLKTDAGKKFYAQLEKHSQSKKDPRDYEKHILGNRLLKFTNQPLESNIVEIIRKLQNRGIKVIALTHANTGSLGRTIIPSLPKWRYEKLRDVGIDFSSSFEQQEIPLTNLTSQANRHPLFYRGIVMTDDFPKGEVLAEFLDVTKLEPKKVIFIDDRIHYVQSVHNEMQKRGIDFKGYVYRAIDALPQVFDQKILDYQLKHLKEHDEFISDEQVKLALSRNRKESTRESIFDKVVSIPKKLVLDIPKLPPYCDEIADLKMGFADIENGKLYV
ncbi:MAG: DUF2608 domain-containing protein [bacterium]